MTKPEQALVFSPLEVQTETAVSSGLRLCERHSRAPRDPRIGFESPVGFVLPPNPFLTTLGAQDFCSLFLWKAALRTPESPELGKPAPDERGDERHPDVRGPRFKAKGTKMSWGHFQSPGRVGAGLARQERGKEAMPSA